MSQWSRSDVIGLLGLVIATGSFSVALIVVPEFRQLLGLDRSPTAPSAVEQPSPLTTSTSPQPSLPSTSPALTPSPTASTAVNARPTASMPTIILLPQLQTPLPKRIINAPASWCQSVKDGRQFCEANNICIESKETHLLKLKENGCQ